MHSAYLVLSLLEVSFMRFEIDKNNGQLVLPNTVRALYNSIDVKNLSLRLYRADRVENTLSGFVA